MLEALWTSLIVALSSAVLATLFGTMAALGLQRVRGWVRTMFDALIYVALMIPGIVIGIATLVALVTVFDALNPALAALWPAALGAPPQLQLGLVSLIAAHTLFTMALAVLIVRARLAGMDRSLVEASMDLYADALGHLPADHPAAAAAGDRRQPAAGLHLQLRRFRDRVLRRRAPTPRCRSTSSPRSGAA